MGPDMELKDNSNLAMDVMAGKGNGIMPRDSEDKLMHCGSNYEDTTFSVEPSHDDQALVPDVSEDVEVDITDCASTDVNGHLEGRYEDASESMSSFGGSASETENFASVSDPEIESQLHVGDARASISHEYDGAYQMRKKKLTDHWRRFIRPLMWRCKWIELQVKEFQSQALKYDRELAENEQRKQFDFDSFIVEGFDTRSLQFSTCMRRKKAIKRKKRKRLEETTDVASYMLQHNLFSYYENKKSSPDGAWRDDSNYNLDKLANGEDEFGFQNGWPSQEPISGDNICEHILGRIEVVQSQVHKLKAQIDKVVSENPRKFASVNSLSLPAPCDELAASDQNPASPPENEDGMPLRSRYTSSQHRSGCNMGDLVPESAVSSHGVVAPLPDMIENTVQDQFGLTCENTEERPPIHNPTAMEEMQYFKNFGKQLAEKLQASMEKQTDQVSEADLPMPAETIVARACCGGKSLPTSRSNVSNKKRKRVRRKSGASGWSRRS